jgi:hypothetical protein
MTLRSWLKIPLLFLPLMLLGGARLAQAREEALAPEFLDYLGAVEASGLKGGEGLTLEEVAQMLNKFFQGRPETRKKDEKVNQKGPEHGDAPKN